MAFAMRIRSQKVYVTSFTLDRHLSRVVDGIRHQLGEGVAKTKTEGYLGFRDSSLDSKECPWCRKPYLRRE